eukprot:364777-Chlamydomonas_euryale.AAC.10
MEVVCAGTRTGEVKSAEGVAKLNTAHASNCVHGIARTGLHAWDCTNGLDGSDHMSESHA